MALKRVIGTSMDLLWAAEARLRAMRVGEAFGLFNDAERAGCDPDACAAGRWTCHMLWGDFERAWQESDRITLRGSPDPNRFWDGRSLDGRRVLIRCLHGLGDTLQFIRYAPLLRQRTAFLAIEAQPSLRALLEGSELADAVLTWGDPEPTWDAQVEVVELPRVFRTTVATIPKRVPYLCAGPKLTDLANGKPRRLRVGLIWSSSNYNPARSIPLGMMAELFAIAGVDFVSLQAGAEGRDIEPWQEAVPSLYRETHTALDTAAVVQSLDLVITVDTMMAHLAGALGIPVWTLLPYECDWRWMLERTDSPWYPTMGLLRQPEPGGWRVVIDEVKSRLTQLLTSKGRLRLL